MELFKKIGAGVIVLALVVLMVVTFEFSQIQSALDTMQGRGEIGEFAGEEITPAAYNYFYQRCQQQANIYRNQFRDLLQQNPGALSSFFNMDECIRRGLRDVYAANAVGRRVGLGVSEQSMHEAAVAEARAEFQNQTNLLPDDRLDLETIYRNIVSFLPLELRAKFETAQQTGDLLFGEPMPVSDSVARAAWAAEEIQLDLRVLRFNNPELRELYKRTLDVSEAEVRAAYEEEQAALEDEADKKTFEDEREFVRNRLLNKRAQARVDEVRKQLAELGQKPGGLSLEAARDLIGKDASVVRGASLAGLGAVELQSGQRMSLLNAEFLAEFGAEGAGQTYGPYTEGEFTILVVVDAVRRPAGDPPAEELAQAREEAGRRLMQSAADFLLTEAALRGRFELRATTEPQQPQPGQPGAPAGE